MHRPESVHRRASYPMAAGALRGHNLRIYGHRSTAHSHSGKAGDVQGTVPALAQMQEYNRQLGSFEMYSPWAWNNIFHTQHVIGPYHILTVVADH